MSEVSLADQAVYETCREETPKVSKAKTDAGSLAVSRLLRHAQAVENSINYHHYPSSVRVDLFLEDVWYASERTLGIHRALYGRSFRDRAESIIRTVWPSIRKSVFRTFLEQHSDAFPVIPPHLHDSLEQLARYFDFLETIKSDFRHLTKPSDKRLPSEK